jgi:hypothetical protein
VRLEGEEMALGQVSVSMLMYHRLLRCTTALTRQYIITSAVFKFRGLISAPALGLLPGNEVINEYTPALG